ncbi:OLC1v1033410C1 [Oldenlandia corymbosa var. corymbosa]|uniref:OLC1v1033410C1 n=1 Tax=Oldenlandia corymbosa var. corymbosa TaxID=529605 RepID=A0AAV1CNC0_OLDCO|nr:OLC1v1033410C1 [Oldenlandia corymbosa var. corymbosa]
MLLADSVIINQIRHNLKPTSRNPFSSLFFSVHTRSALPRYLEDPNKPNHKWNTSHSFVLSNPILSLLETSCKSIAHLKQIQSQMIVTGLISDGLASSRLVAFSALSDVADLSYCKRLLCDLPSPNAFSYNVAIRACSDSENPVEALLLYKQLLGLVNSYRDCLRPDHFTFPLLFKTCARLGFYYMGFQILVHVMKMGYEIDVFVRNGLIHFLFSVGEVEAARQVFDESSVRDLVSWNSLIHGFVKVGEAPEAFRVYVEMESEGVKPDEVTMIGLVSSCAQLEDLELGREAHRSIERMSRGAKFQDNSHEPKLPGSKYPRIQQDGRAYANVCPLYLKQNPGSRIQVCGSVQEAQSVLTLNQYVHIFMQSSPIPINQTIIAE